MMSYLEARNPQNHRVAKFLTWKKLICFLNNSLWLNPPFQETWRPTKVLPKRRNACPKSLVGLTLKQQPPPPPPPPTTTTTNNNHQQPTTTTTTTTTNNQQPTTNNQQPNNQQTNPWILLFSPSPPIGWVLVIARFRRCSGDSLAFAHIFEQVPWNVIIW